MKNYSEKHHMTVSPTQREKLDHLNPFLDKFFPVQLSDFQELAV